MEASAALEIHETPVRFWHRISTKEKALLFEHLSNLIEGGVTALSALKSFLEKTKNPKLSEELSQMVLLIESGDPFSTAMKKLPKVYSKAEISIVESGEQSGTMQKSFESIARDLRGRDEIRVKLKAALTYPVVVMGFLVGAIALIMAYVVPKLIPLFDTVGGELPGPTAALIAASSFVRSYFLAMAFIAAMAAFAFRAWVATYDGKLAYDRFALRLPLVGPLYRNYLIVRISSMFSLLIAAGVPIIKMLKLTGESTGNLVYEEAFAEIASSLEKGKKLAESIEAYDPENRIFPSDFVQIIAAGERTSTVNRVTGKLSEQYSREVDASIGTLVRFVEPVSVVIAGVFVLWFAFAIFAAVMRLTELAGT